MDYSYDPYLSHYGVKGMKWGVHRSSGKAAYEHYKGSRQAKKDFYNIIKEAGLA